MSLAPGVRRPQPDLLVGGLPLRVLRLSPAGVRALDALLAGREEPGVEVLRRRLVARGLLPASPGPGRLEDVTVVVPAHGPAAPVLVTLAGVPDGVPVVVVDDASPVPLSLPPRPGLRVLRLPANAGPGAARNAGAALATTALVAFVDADVELPTGWLERLTGHLAEEGVVAAAPRVVSRPGDGLAGVLEERFCALDLGPVPGEVRPGTRLGYVPSTVLVVQRDALEATGGFAEELRVGEDVDLVWRLAARGAVRYDPRVVARHGPRARVLDVLRRRRDYGESAGALDRRHPGRVHHLSVSPWSLLPWAAAAVHPALAVAALGVLVARAPRALPSLPPAEARRLTLAGQWWAATALGRYAVRPGLPLTAALAVAVPPARRVLALLAPAYAAAVAPSVVPGPVRGLPVRAGLRVAEDLAYGAGVWRGCWAERRWRPLLPALDRGRPAAS